MYDHIARVMYDELMFFFSSRRRHTRLQGDWSSDVCSSDLAKSWPTTHCCSAERSALPGTRGAAAPLVHGMAKGWLYPHIVGRRPLTAFLPGVQHAARLDQHEAGFPLGAGLVLRAFGDHVELALAQQRMAITEVDAQLAIQHQEGFIRFGMRVPDELALHAHDLELVVVHLGNDAGAPLTGEAAEFLGEVDGLVGAVSNGERHGQTL